MRPIFVHATGWAVVWTAFAVSGTAPGEDRSDRANESAWRDLPLIDDGKVAQDWRHVGWGALEVDGQSLITRPNERGMGLLVYTKEKLGDCRIRIVYRPENANSNAGVFIRIDDGILDWIGKDSLVVRREEDGKLSEEMLARMEQASEKEEAAWYAVHHGYEVQMCDAGDPLHRTGAVYSLAPSTFGDGKPFSNRWRTMIITLDGDRIVVEQDGQVLSRFDSADKPPRRKVWHEPKREPRRPRRGYIGLQTHDPGDVVRFRQISVQPLSE